MKQRLVGMGLVGDVVLTPDVGANLYKGEEFGFFQFGGSDVIMIFQGDMVEIAAEVGQHYLQGQKNRDAEVSAIDAGRPSAEVSRQG